MQYLVVPLYFIEPNNLEINLFLDRKESSESNQMICDGSQLQRLL
jgi:hypothetical protein